VADTFLVCLAFTLGQEGGWSDNPDDPGGCTMKGVTLPTYCAWKHDDTLSCDDLRNITDDEVTDLYHDDYWQHAQGDTLPPGLDLMVFDAAVNMGVSRSVRLLQQQLPGVDADGCMGPKTLAAVRQTNVVTLIGSLGAAHIEFYRHLPTYPIFGKGWMGRVGARVSTALKMQQDAATVTARVRRFFSARRRAPRARPKPP
jgi:lysozyme family protein